MFHVSKWFVPIFAIFCTSIKCSKTVCWLISNWFCCWWIVFNLFCSSMFYLIWLAIFSLFCSLFIQQIIFILFINLLQLNNLQIFKKVFVFFCAHVLKHCFIIGCLYLYFIINSFQFCSQLIVFYFCSTYYLLMTLSAITFNSAQSLS